MKTAEIGHKCLRKSLLDVAGGNLTEADIILLTSNNELLLFVARVTKGIIKARQAFSLEELGCVLTDEDINTLCSDRDLLLRVITSVKALIVAHKTNNGTI